MIFPLQNKPPAVITTRRGLSLSHQIPHFSATSRKNARFRR